LYDIFGGLGEWSIPFFPWRIWLGVWEVVHDVGLKGEMGYKWPLDLGVAMQWWEEACNNE
jgi:hypothetical protein